MQQLKKVIFAKLFVLQVTYHSIFATLIITSDSSEIIIAESIFLEDIVLSSHLEEFRSIITIMAIKVWMMCHKYLIKEYLLRSLGIVTASVAINTITILQITFTLLFNLAQQSTTITKAILTTVIYFHFV